MGFPHMTMRCYGCETRVSNHSAGTHAFCPECMHGPNLLDKAKEDLKAAHDALRVFVETWERTGQHEKLDVALRMAKEVLEI